ncbi:unnamed protein product [Dicrocoelium dendriticum]|nr:unnamed protein product [Dicrocoelium dendriticum]
MARVVERFNSVHTNLRVTCEVERANCLPLLDLLISRKDNGHVRRSVYQKSTWSGQYLHFKKFTPMRYKRTLVKTLLSRARRLYPANCLNDELELIAITTHVKLLRSKFCREAQPATKIKGLGTGGSEEESLCRLIFQG